MRSIASVARFIASEAGALALSFAIAVPALLVMAGMATDYAFMSRYRADLQAVADAAATAGAREFAVANSNAAQIESVVTAFAMQKVKADISDYTVTTVIDQPAASLSVQVSRNWRPFFVHMISAGITPISASATAKAVGSDKICVLGLNETSSGTIALSGDSKLTGNGCAVLSNSTSSTGLASYKNSLIDAEMICSAGGIGGSASNFTPAPVTDCPVTPDPLQSRTAPAFGLCDYVNFSVSGTTATILPGTYCGGLLIANGSDVTFSPGIYVIKDGRFQVTHISKIYGVDVSFYFAGTGSTILFAAGTTIELYAPRTGDMAGILFFEDRNAPLGQVHDIVSENARQLVGTIYLSRGVFQVGSKKPVADLSAYTAIIANKIILNRYPALVLNSNYHLTAIPVPSGLTGIGGRVVLVQ